jgi:hypothetical protein
MEKYFIKSIVIVFTFLFTSYSFSQPTAEQVRQAMNERIIPNWNRSVEQIASFQHNLPDPFKPTWSMLDELSKSKTGALTKVSNPVDINELIVNSSWLRWKILVDKADGRYSYKYAYLLGMMNAPDGNFKKESAVFFYHARLAMNIDGERCVDKTSPNSIIDGYETQPTFNIQEKISKMTPSERAKIQLEAIAIEYVVGERPVNEKICTQGNQSVLSAILQGQKPKKAENQSLADGKLAGQNNTYTVDTSNIKAQLVPEEKWKEIRIKILDEMFLRAVKDL